MIKKNFFMHRPLLEVSHLGKSYGKQQVLEDLSFVVSEGQKIALIGRNGCGKTTLARILTGQEGPDGGNVQYFSQARLGVIHQQEKIPQDISSLMFLESASHKPSWEVKKMGHHFGLSDASLVLPPAELSGGYQMRVKLTAMFLQDPNILLLDEPVNYLDLQTLLLLEKRLKDYKGSFLLIAHDREFLQNTCTETFEIERGKLVQYPGTVQEYFLWKEEQKQFLLRNNKKIKREIAHQQEFVDRFRYKASLASRAQNKLKHIAKLRHHIAKIDAAFATVRMHIPSPVVTKGFALRVRDLSIGYNDRVIASNISFELWRGEKLVIAGENGKGKSTLLKTLIGRLSPLGGNLQWYHKADIGYYDQKTDATLFPQETVLAYLTRMAPSSASGERLLMMAGNFLFRDDDLEKPTSVLSGGERARLCLAGLLLHEHTVLILDEPTNHLDVETAEALACALRDYQGTVIFVSHARTFVNTLADRIIEIREGTARSFMGTYEEYVEELSETMEEEEDAYACSSKEETGVISRKIQYHQLKELQRSQGRLEQKMAELDKEKSNILAFFFENPLDYDPEKSRRLNDIEEEYIDLEKQWFSFQEDVESAKHPSI